MDPLFEIFGLGVDPRLIVFGFGIGLLVGMIEGPVGEWGPLGVSIFLGLGMLVGSEGIGGVEFDDAELTRTLGTIGLVLILFEGGLTAGWGAIRTTW